MDFKSMTFWTVESLQLRCIPSPLSMFPSSARTWRLSPCAPTLTPTPTNKPLVYLGASPPTDALLVCQCAPLLFCSLLWTLGATEASQVSAVYCTEPLLPPSPQRGAPPPRRAQSCGYRSGALPVNKINQGEHQVGKKNSNKLKKQQETAGLYICSVRSSSNEGVLSSCLVTVWAATFLPI